MGKNDGKKFPFGHRQGLIPTGDGHGGIFSPAMGNGVRMGAEDLSRDKDGEYSPSPTCPIVIHSHKFFAISYGYYAKTY